MDSKYRNELLKKIKDIEKGLKYYIQKNAELETRLNYYENAYENRVNEYLKEKKD